MPELRPPLLTTVVVHWRDEEHVHELLAAWPEDPRCELVIVDNSSSLRGCEKAGRVKIFDPGRNLGFAGGVNRGLEAARSEWVMLLNPDARPEDGAVERLLTSLNELEDAGLVPALVSADGALQTRWQLRPLPSPWGLVAQIFFFASVAGPRRAPERGTPIEQPAGAALVLRRRVLENLGGLDEGYYPAWFEDVDLARRLDRAGHRLLYEPRARFRHATAGSLPALGYGPFLWIYYKNLLRYLERHHGHGFALLARFFLPLGMLLRIALLPLRRPRRAASRVEAAVGLAAVIHGWASGWQKPRRYAERFSRRDP